MNAMTPSITEQRTVLEFLADPNRPKELLALMKQAEAAEQKASAAKAEADAAMKAAADELTKARELQDINTKKSAALRDQAQALADKAEAIKAADDDNKARLTDWEQRLKDRAEALERRAEQLGEIGAAQVMARRKLEEDVAAANEIIDRANRITAAMG
jgi:chromosome segregation ATPase